MRYRDRGFTLIEILLAIMLILAVSATITSSFFQGIRVYERLRHVSDQAEAALFFERITRDLKNSVVIASSPFSTTENSISFVTWASADLESGLDSLTDPLQVTYRLDQDAGCVVRAESDPFSAKLKKEQTVLQGVQSFEIHLEGDNAGSPARVIFFVENGASGNRYSYRKDIVVPLGRLKI